MPGLYRLLRNFALEEPVDGAKVNSVVIMIRDPQAEINPFTPNYEFYP
jgi:hypothetical protein